MNPVEVICTMPKLGGSGCTDDDQPVVFGYSMQSFVYCGIVDLSGHKCCSSARRLGSALGRMLVALQRFT
jgi:hypothetical protein